MPDDDTSGGIEHEAVEHVPDSQTVDPQTSPNDPHSPARQRESSQEVQHEVQQLGDRVKRAERWMIGLTFAIAFFGLCAVVVGILQWSAMRGQLREMKSGGIDTHNLAVAAGKQAAAAKDSALAARDAVTSAAQASHLDQRAWIGPDSYGTVIEVGKPLETMVMFKNTGKTPAVNIHGTTLYEGTKWGMKPNFDYSRKGIHHINIGMMPPNGEYTADVQFRPPHETKPLILAQPMVDSIQDGTVTVYVHGRLDYEDIFGGPHWFTYCSFYLPSTKKFGTCNEHNDTDKPPQRPKK